MMGSLLIIIIDMMIREVRALTTGELSIIRLGSCGGIGKNTKLASVSVLDTGVMVNSHPNICRSHGIMITFLRKDLRMVRT
jgi:purine-nucleoside phosphorylase